MITVAQIDAWLAKREGETIEFKEAKTSFSVEDLTRYCVALANERGGHLVLGISPKLPRRVVGSKAFPDLPERVHQLLQRLHLRIDAEEVDHPDGRVVVFTAPPRPLGMPLEYGGTYWMRAGESLTGMTPDRLKRIFDEIVPDYSAEVCPGVNEADLDPEAVELFRDRWCQKSGNTKLKKASPRRLLEDAELLVGGGVTRAALVLLGTHHALGRHLAQAEVVFEYRHREEPGPAAQRVEFRQGFLTYIDELWRLVNLRNDINHFLDGFVMRGIPSFNEEAVREAILNAVSHRDYRHAGSVFVRQFPRRIEIVSPGGFPEGITAENLLTEQFPRNRRLAEALGRCGFVERAGQGADKIFETCIRDGKALPDFTDTTPSKVALTLHGEVRDKQFVRFLERVTAESGLSFGINDLLVLSHVHDEKPIPSRLDAHVKLLVQAGILERLSRGKLLLSRRFYQFVGRAGEYTRRRGLDHETNKALLATHIEQAGEAGAPMEELTQVLPSKSRDQVKRLLQELRLEGRVHARGARRGARWHAGPPPSGPLGDQPPKRSRRSAQ